jgi:3-isopropylmalate dehydrogenase
MAHRIAVIAGDGIGPEVIHAAIPVISRAAEAEGAQLEFEMLPYSADHYLKTGVTLPEDAFRHLRDGVDAILVGALGDPRVPENEHARDILLGLRFRLDLYINFRPAVLMHPRLTPLKGEWSAERGGKHNTIDIAIFRENTEGQYTAMGRVESEGTPEEKQVSEEIHTQKGVRRIIEAAFQWAETHGRTRITLCDKSNAVPYQRIWGRLFAEVGAKYPGIEQEHKYVDALAMDLVRKPERYQVIVANNLHGDILSDLGAALVGGLGLAASANLHPGRAGLFEPVHGSAPYMAGRNVANPMAAVLTGGLMMEALGFPNANHRLEAAVRAVLAGGPTSPDIGGKGSTTEVAEAIGAALTT